MMQKQEQRLAPHPSGKTELRANRFPGVEETTTHDHSRHLTKLIEMPQEGKYTIKEIKGNKKVELRINVNYTAITQEGFAK
jgi:hypothetical protein